MMKRLIHAQCSGSRSPKGWTRLAALIVLSPLAFGALEGCSGATDVSREPSRDEIKEGIDRRLKVLEQTNLPEAEKERQRQQILGSVPSQNQTRESGLGK